jgi:hypothetical protein
LFIVERPEMLRRFASSYSWLRVRSLLLLRALGLLEELLERELLLLERELLRPEREPLFALGLLEELLERELLRPLREPELAERELLEREERELLLALGLLELERDPDRLEPDLLELLASPVSARSLFTVRAAICSARPFWPRFS